MQIIELKEHEQLSQSDVEKISAIDENIFGKLDGRIDYLGISIFKSEYWASYYIGAQWIKDNELGLIVTPKLKNIDFERMFLCALSSSETDYFSRYYSIDFDKEPLPTNKTQNLLTPLLVCHFVVLMQKLVRRGVKKDYIVKESNLKSKIKGKIVFPVNLRTNLLKSRRDKFYCKYQEFSEDIPENRLLKKALLFCDRLISVELNSYENIKPMLNSLLSRFDGISDSIEVSEITRIRSNVVFKEYNNAIRVAKMILRRYQYSIDNVENVSNTPPFWIDMSRLFELWVLSKLQNATNSTIEFQKEGHSVYSDFVIEDYCMILDAKYKPDYQGNHYDVDDIRELSGYSRDEKLLPNASSEPRCVILYPDTKNLLRYDKPLSEQGEEISGFRNFYKIGIEIPVKG